MRHRFGLLMAGLALCAVLPAAAAAKPGDIVVGTFQDPATVDRLRPGGALSNIATGPPLDGVYGIDLYAGSILAADGPADSLFRITPATGAVTPIKSGSPIDNPLDVEVGPDGIAYLAQPSPGNVVQVDPRTGDASVRAASGLSAPYALAIAPNGTLYVAGGDSVFSISPGSSEADLVVEVPGSELIGIDRRPDGLLVVLDHVAGELLLVTPSLGSVTPLYQAARLQNDVYNIALDARGRILVGNYLIDRVIRIELRTRTQRFVGGTVANVEGIAVEPPQCDGRPATLVGTVSRDVIRGGPLPDVIAGLRGNDRLIGLGANDVLCGARGRDLLVGGGGEDRLRGGPGRDRLHGGPGGDVLRGGPGRDRERQ